MRGEEGRKDDKYTERWMDGYIDTYVNGWIGERGRKSFTASLLFF